MSEDGTNSLKSMSVGVVALISVAAIILVGIAIVNQYSYTLRTATNVSIDGITPYTNNYTLVGATGQYPYLQSLDGCYNISDPTHVNESVVDVDFTITEGNEDGGFIIVTAAGSDEWNGSTINCTSLSYLSDNTATASADNFVSGMTIFATFIGIIVLSMMGKTVVNIFKKD